MGVITLFVMAWTRMDRDLFVGILVVTSVIISWSQWDIVRAPSKDKLVLKIEISTRKSWKSAKIEVFPLFSNTPSLIKERREYKISF